jgi:hypothetical protein
LLERESFWTPEYLSRKLALYRAAGIANLILCIDRDRAGGDGDLPAGALVVRYRGHVDAAAVRCLVEGAGRGTPSPAELTTGSRADTVC